MMRWLIVIMVMGGVWKIWNSDGNFISELSADLAEFGRVGNEISGATAKRIKKIAPSVKPGELVLYTTTTCPYCRQAKNWFNENGFAFTECDTMVDRRCAREYDQHDAGGVPYLVVHRGGKVHHMRNGLNVHELLEALDP